MKIALVYPRQGTEVVYKSPIGLASLAAMVKGLSEISVRIFDLAIPKETEKFKEYLRTEKPEFVGLTFTMALRKNAFDVAKEIRKLSLSSVILGGGADATSNAKYILKNSEIDICIIGEGEITFFEIIDAALKNKKDISKIKGLVYKKKGKIHETEPRPFIENLDILPAPARELIGMNYYLYARPIMPLPYPATDIDASRGCFGNCTFCQPNLRKMFGSKIRNKSPKKVVDEIEFLIDRYGIRGINIGNDEPTFDKEWIESLCREIINRRIKIKLICGTRVDCIDKERLTLMKKAGFISLSFGVESGSQKILNNLRKGITVEQTKKAFRLCEDVGICARANFMIGNLEDTRETLQQSIDLLREVRPDFIFVSAVHPTPGTDLYTLAEKKGLLRRDVIGDFGYNIGRLKLKNLTDQEIREYIKKIIMVYKIGFLKYIFNPKLFVKKLYLFKALFFYWLSLASNPRLFADSLKYYLSYGKHIRGTA